MTGIRGIAAVWVMLLHAQIHAIWVFSLPLLAKIPLFSIGWRGVDLFFMLSGFILMYAHGQEFHEIRKAALIRFARLRFTRVYPLNAAVALLIGVLVVLQPGFVAWERSYHLPSDYSAGAFVRTMLLANRWFLPGNGEWNVPVWSLSMEVLGYAAFPFLAFWALRITQKWLLIGLSSLSLVAAYVFLQAVHAPQWENGQVAVVRMVSCFVTGIAVYRLWTLAGESAGKSAGWITAVSAVGILVVGSLSHGGISINFFFALLLYGLAFQRGIVNRLLSSRIVVFLGEISFPLYLTHLTPLLWLWYFIPLKLAAYSTLQKSAILMCWAAGVMALSTLLHYFVEKPFHALGRRWAGARVPG
ncbi:MAG: acyltransferase [Terracidiphilus sp.]|jgi:peptidoglycan/LPS O-acetylase OafA/YrhL